MPRGKYKRELKHYQHLFKYSFKRGIVLSEERKMMNGLMMKKLWESGRLKSHPAWNKGLTIQDPRVRKYTLSRINSPYYEEVKRKIGMKNSISLLGNIPHNKGKTKENYEPLKKHLTSYKADIYLMNIERNAEFLEVNKNLIALLNMKWFLQRN